MRHVLNVLFQMDEASRYIRDGRTEQLRLALLLLDNAVELQLDRRIRYELHNESFSERRRRDWLRTPEEHRPTDVSQWLVEWRPLSGKEKRSIDYKFDAKVDSLVERWSLLPAPFGRSLKRLHRYRNEAYHQARVRQDTLRTSTLLLLDLNCRLFTHLPLAMVSWSSSDNFSWFNERFGMSVNDLAQLDGGFNSTVLDDLRLGLIPSDAAFIDVLHENLLGRYEQIFESLAYIVEMTSAKGLDDALKQAQFDGQKQYDSFTDLEADYRSFQPPVTMSQLTSLRQPILDVAGISDRIEAFAAFAEVEEEMEPAEEAVANHVYEIDDWINDQVDALRGR